MQTAYTQYQNAAYKGMLYDLRMNDHMSYSAEGAVGIGMPVILGTNKERQVKQVVNSVGQGILVIGIATAQFDIEQAAGGVVGYLDKETVPVMKEGRIWVETVDAVVAGTVANLSLATGNFTDEAVAAGIEAITQCRVRFMTGTTAAGLAVVEVTRL